MTFATNSLTTTTIGSLVTGQSWMLLAVFLGVLFVAAWPLGLWLTRVADGRFPAPLSRGARMERGLFRLAGVDVAQGMGWKTYALALLVFNLIGVLVVYGLQRFQLSLPLNPQGLPAVSADSAFNTAISFASNTNWQGYSGEATMSYLTQMLALTVQNFLSAATGIAVVFAFIRGLAARSSASLGNAWVDLTRVTLYVLLPLSIAFALFLTSQGVVQNLDAYLPVTTLQGGADAMQSIAMGPVASQEAIKMLGTNGGGFFNANSAHPFENPTALTNLLQMLSIFLIPTALCVMFGKLVGDLRQAGALLAAMTLIFLIVATGTIASEQQGNPLIAALGVDQAHGMSQSGGNMEGKETRFGIGASALFATVTTAASCGAVNAMHDSFTPLGGMGPMVLMQLGEVVFGGVGTGLYGMLVVALVAVFLAGLMIGRTPEYLGKKIEPFEMKMAAIALLAAPILTLAGTALAGVHPEGLAGLANPGPHGFSEMLYALTSGANNNGSAFAGLSANTPFYNTLQGVAMWFGRFAVIVAVLALAGSLAAKKRVPVTAGTLPTHGPLFVTLLVGTVVLIGLLNFVPALALGPIVEHLMLYPGH
ncbi:potassium-transporting ATPase potassium-binding subunit [Pigmentiphaga litoralis]|uniref:potassium-transporting ATPase subunit KdpA n=1 Tax=Pigmentiphaga litoralis TaxID=516702 RepID=UPI00167ACDA7|nr:potassium-transporting ATPase subunit KdpA [Pigmentiphaga litoralis]GGX10295.1 potassium-transporting ATPase potassium-binding subunit [Pigmentiphaga litoralis]